MFYEANCLKKKKAVSNSSFISELAASNGLFSLFIQEHKQEIARLQDTIRRQEEELCNLRAERKLYVRPELENSLDRVERTIVNEINEECRRNSGILGNNPRKVNLKKYETHKKNWNT